MIDHGLQYLIELDGNKKPEELFVVSFPLLFSKWVINQRQNVLMSTFWFV